MARKALTAKAYIDVDGERTLWYEVDSEGNVTWHLPENLAREYKKIMLNNIGEHMSEYYSLHKNSA